MKNEPVFLVCLCNHCSQRLEFPSEGLGTEIKCPKCGLTTLLYAAPSQDTELETRGDVEKNAHLAAMAFVASVKAEAKAKGLEPVKPLESALPALPVPEKSQIILPAVEESGVAQALMIIAALELVIAPLAGLGVGCDNTSAGWLIFVSGIVSGLILLGFARVVEHTNESSQRLRRIEMLIQNK